MTKNDFKDHLNRKDLAGKVLDTLLEQEQVNVMSLNGGWGSGKTYFLEYMKRQAEDTNILFITHNVWENDYLEDPFLSIMAELLEKLEEHKTLFVKAGELSIETLRAFFDRLHSAIQVEATGEVGLSIPFFAGVKIETKVDLSKLILPQKPELKDYEKLKIAKKDFKEALEKIIAELPNKKLIIAIDELDRTRPEYAIRTLEVIKHFFDINGLKFILAVDKKQLQNTVKQMFGQETETDCYLRKFVDIEYNLPAPDLEYFIHAQYRYLLPSLFKHTEYIFFEVKKISRFKPDEKERIFRDYMVRSIWRWVQQRNLSLRDIEKFILHLKIVLDKIPSESIIALELLMDLIYIYKKNESLFGKSLEVLNTLKKHVEAVHPTNDLRNNDYNLIDTYPKRQTNAKNQFLLLFLDAYPNKLYDEEWADHKRIAEAKAHCNALPFGYLLVAIETIANFCNSDDRFNYSIFFNNQNTGVIAGALEGKLNQLLGKTLVDYYQAIQFASRFE